MPSKDKEAENQAERAMDNVIEFMKRKESKQEQDAFLHQILFGM